MKTYIRSENKQALFEEDSGGFFKKHYRPSEHFTAYYKSIISDFLIYKDFCVFIDDGLSNDVSIDELLTNAQPKLDFNDNYYYLLAKSRNYPIITDDIDFFVPGIEIYTFNMKLYKKGTDSIKPIQKSPLASKKQE